MSEKSTPIDIADIADDPHKSHAKSGGTKSTRLEVPVPLPDQVTQGEAAMREALEAQDSRWESHSVHSCGLPMLFIRDKMEIVRYLKENDIGPRSRKRIMATMSTVERDLYELYSRRVSVGKRVLKDYFTTALRMFIKKNIPIDPRTTPDLISEPVTDMEEIERRIKNNA